MTWEEFKKSTRQFSIGFGVDTFKKEITDIDCPKCGKKIYVRTDIVLASYPPKRQYECDCGWIGYN